MGHTEGIQRSYIPFYSIIMKQQIFHILTFLNFCGNMNQPENTNKKCGRLWKIISVVCSMTAMLNFIMCLKHEVDKETIFSPAGSNNIE